MTTIKVKKQDIEKINKVRDLITQLKITQDYIFKDLLDKLDLNADNDESEKIFDYVYNDFGKLVEKVNLP